MILVIESTKGRAKRSSRSAGQTRDDRLEDRRAAAVEARGVALAMQARREVSQECGEEAQRNEHGQARGRGQRGPQEGVKLAVGFVVRRLGGVVLVLVLTLPVLVLRVREVVQARQGAGTDSGEG